MKICYLIQTHKNPEQIYRLIRTIKNASSNSTIIISHDNRNCQLDLAPLAEFNQIHLFIHHGGRGDFSMVQSYLDTVKWLRENKISFDWLINLTGQDYPIKPIPQIEHFLANTNYDGFLEYFPVISTESQWSIQEGYSRYFFQYQQISQQVSSTQQKILKPLKIINYLQPLVRINFSYDIRYGIKKNNPFNQDFLCYGGSFFCTLSQKCVQYLDEYTQKNPKFVAYYHQVSVPVESFIQTILINSKSFNLANDCKRYFDFTNSRDGSPCLLNTSYYESLKESQAHFARKLDLAQDRKIFDLIDENFLATANLT
ncbi:MAG: beta-1,6-N-acetylglucosaminyltransferase [Oscillatoria sp. PMC 1068.18]|nr:beta-1,6-N-acetylglucosaminyltransferase [Oscillatoria sp. PMC 1076.18]MEC4987689.1 beta-1,6-N-acetylglucosaminyltransferase [Oscillatoria sp. PMC 1068.18]